MKELEEKELRHSGENWYIERSRLKDIIEEKNQQLEKIKRDEELHRDHIDNIRREVSFLYVYKNTPVLTIFLIKNDELRRKLEDFDKVTKIKRSMTYDSSEHERELRELKNRWNNINKKFELYSFINDKSEILLQIGSRRESPSFRDDAY